MKTEDFAKFQELYKRKEELEQELEKFKTPVTVCFVDIVGSTRYFEQRGDYAGMIYVHACIDRLIPEAEKHGGTICKTIGDAIMAYFTDPAEGVRAAIDMQLSLEEFNKGKTDADQMHVRIGLNYGKGVVKDKDPDGVLSLMPRHARYYFCQAAIPRAMPAGDLLSRASRFGLQGQVVAEVNEALAQAKAAARPDDLIVVGGSTYVVAEIDGL